MRLRRKIEDLENQIQKVQRAPEGTDKLAQGEELFSIAFSFDVYRKNEKGNWKKNKNDSGNISVSWDKIFSYIAPVMLEPLSERGLADRLNSFISGITKEYFSKNYPDSSIRELKIFDPSFRTIIIQLRALNLIRRQLQETEYHRWINWQLTPYGENYMTQIIAIPKS